MSHEFSADVTLEPAPWQLAREIDPSHADRLTNQRGTAIASDRLDRTIVLFTSDHTLQWTQQDHPSSPSGLSA